MHDLTTPHGRHEYALETHQLALELWDYIFPPWRWREWSRRRRVLHKRMRTLWDASPPGTREKLGPRP